MYTVISLGQRPRREKREREERKKKKKKGERERKIVRCLRGKRAVTLGYDCDPLLGRATSSYIET